MPNLSNENIFLLLSSTWIVMDAIVLWDALKPRSYSYLAGGCLDSMSHKLPSWRETTVKILLLPSKTYGQEKNYWLHKAVEAHLFSDFFQSLVHMSSVDIQKYPEWYFDPYISLKIYLLSYPHWNLSDYVVTNYLKISSGSQVKVVKLFCFFCLFSEVEPLWNPSGSVIATHCTYPEIEEV